MFLTASTTSGQCGGLFLMYGIASFENFGGTREFETLPPTQIEMPSVLALLMVHAGHTV